VSAAVTSAAVAPLPAEAAGVDLWSGVVGQPAAVAELRSAVAAPVHAYLLVGPRGSGKRALARAFAAALLSSGRQGDDAVRHAELALAEAHADLLVVERKGASISVEQADEIIAAASRASVEGGPKVLVLDEFHLVTTAGPKLLKSIEEPPPNTVFVILADDVTPDLVTIASRCLRIDLGAVPNEAIVDRLVAEGVVPERAEEAAAVASGDLSRARLLATDGRLALRRRAWHDVPDRLDGTGATAVEVADEVLAMITDAMAPLAEAQAAEAAELEERVKARGERGSGRSQLEQKHKREARRYRSDEVRAGLTELSRRYRDELAVSSHPSTGIEAVEVIADLAREMVRNPNERLQLVALFLRLGRLTSR
jgi:DNA polymerase-3 subunit delta'